MKSLYLIVTTMLFYHTTVAQNFQFPTSGNAINNQLAALTAADGVTLITSIRSTGCTPAASSTFRYGADHVSTGAIYRNTSWSINCMGSMDVIKMDFTSKTIQPQGLKFSIFDVDNGSDSVSVHIYRGAVLVDYTYSLYSPTFVSAHGASPSTGFVGSAGNNSGLNDNRGRIDISCTDIMVRVDSVIITKYNNRNVIGNPSQSFAAFEWTNFIVLPLKILSFSAQPSQAGVDIDWTATGETGSEIYHVELSDNGIYFTTAGTPVLSKTSATTNSYSTRVPMPDRATTLFARLLSKDKNGKILYSKIIQLKMQGNLPSTVHPVIFQNQVTLTVHTGAPTKGMVALAGMDGAIHYKQAILLRAGTNALQLSLPQRLSAGLYRLYYRLENGTVQQHELLKQ